MNYEIKKAILEKIRDNQSICIFRHIRNDGDCVGASKGLKRIIELTWPEKNVYLVEPSPAKYLEFLGPEDPEIADEIYANSLGIVVDTASEARISNKKYTLCKDLVKIDHHIPLESYGSLCWVEEERSSCCEMIVDFYTTFREELKFDKEAATYLYCGMVTDSGRFRYDGTNGNTMRAAGTLLDTGVDIEHLYAHLYLDSFEELKFKAAVYEKMQITENGVAYIIVDKKMQEQFGITLEQASTSVDMLSSIRGCIAWLAFIETGDALGTIRVRLRSRFVHINTVAEKYRGGGHACASGATLYNFDEVQALLRDADAHIQNYKQTNEGWL